MRPAIQTTAAERTCGALTHAAPIYAGLIPFGSLVVPLALWWWNRESVYVATHARASINFQITMLVYYGIGIGYVYVYAVFGLTLLVASALFETVFDHPGGAAGEGRDILRVSPVPAIRETRARRRRNTMMTETAADTPDLTPEEKTWGMLAHLLTFSGFLIPLGSVIAPLVVGVLKKGLRFRAASRLVGPQLPVEPADPRGDGGWLGPGGHRGHS